MSPLERFIERCHTPFDAERNNCAHAALYALQGYWRAELAFSYAMEASTLGRPLLARAKLGANLSGCTCVTLIWPHIPCFIGFGVAETPSGHAIVLRANEAWWSRGKTGAVRIAAKRILAGWSVE